jgi:hypothetical protein
MEVASGLLLVERGDGVAHRERCPHRPLRVVLMGNRRAEDRDDRVADELLDRAAAAFELVARALVVDAEQRADVLGVALLGACRRADEVGEDDADDLPLLAPRGRADRSERGAALGAELRRVRVRGAAGGTGPHWSESMRGRGGVGRGESRPTP